MRWFRKPPVYTLDDTTRALYRSRHLYLLLVALTNLAMAAAVDGNSRILRFVSVLIMAAPVLLFSAFFSEPGRGLDANVFTAPAMYILFFSAVILAIQGRHG